MSVSFIFPFRAISGLLCSCVVLFSSIAHATDISLALGHSADNTVTYRTALQFPWQQRWFDSDMGRLSGYWVAGYTYWDSEDAVNTHSFSASPVLTWEFGGANSMVQPFIDAGIGLAVFSRNKVEDRNLGSSVNFEDRLGFGIRINQRHTIGAQALHYSNAGISSNNAGIESYNIYYRFSF